MHKFKIQFQWIGLQYWCSGGIGNINYRKKEKSEEEEKDKKKKRNEERKSKVARWELKVNKNNSVYNMAATAN